MRAWVCVVLAGGIAVSETASAQPDLRSLVEVARAAAAQAAETWDRVLSIPSPDRRAQELDAYRTTYGLPLPFWAGPAASRGAADVVAVSDEHPCGNSARVRVRTIPSSATEALEPESVLELDGDGKILREWPVPIDTHVVAIRGDEIFVSLWLAPIRVESSGDDVRGRVAQLGIRPNGELRVLVMEEDPLSELAECPEIEGGRFSNNAYLRCWIFRDASGQAERMLAYQGPCT